MEEMVEGQEKRGRMKRIRKRGKKVKWRNFKKKGVRQGKI